MPETMAHMLLTLGSWPCYGYVGCSGRLVGLLHVCNVGSGPSELVDAPLPLHAWVVRSQVRAAHAQNRGL